MAISKTQKWIGAALGVAGLATAVLLSGNSYTTKTIQPGERYYPDVMVNLGIKPGDHIKFLAGNYGESSLLKIHGKPDSMVTIEFEPGCYFGVVNAPRYGIKIEGEFYKVLGDSTGGLGTMPHFVSPDTTNSFLGTSIDFGNSSDYEVAFLNVGYTECGFKSTPMTGRIMKNILIRDNYFHHTDHLSTSPSEVGRCEAVYFGQTDQVYTGYKQPYRFQNIRFTRNKAFHLKGDFIQLTNAENYRIDHNTADSTGLNNFDGQFTNYLAGGGTNGQIDSNTVTNANGPGASSFGYGENKIFGNTFINCAQYSGGNQDVILVDVRTPDSMKMQFRVYNNKITGGKRYAMRDFTTPDHYLPSSYYNNIVSGTIAGDLKTNNVVSLTGNSTDIPPTFTTSITATLITRSISLSYKNTYPNSKTFIEISSDGVTWIPSRVGILPDYHLGTSNGTAPFSTTLNPCFFRTKIIKQDGGVVYSASVKM